MKNKKHKDFVFRISPSVYGRLRELKDTWGLDKIEKAIKVLLDHYEYGFDIVDILPKMRKVYKTKGYYEKKFNEPFKPPLEQEKEVR